jgi:plasmid stability protein
MSILHVRNVPESLYERLQRRAEAERRSLSAEVITLLSKALEEEEKSPQVTLAAIRSRRFFRPADAGAPDGTTMLRRDRTGNDAHSRTAHAPG